MPEVEDVEMKDPQKTDEAVKDKEEKNRAKEPTQEDVDKISFEDIREHIKQIERSVLMKETRFLTRVLRSLGSTRKKFNANVLQRVAVSFCSQATRTSLLEYLEEPMEMESNQKLLKPKSGKSNLSPLPETEVYVHLLFLIYIIDIKNYDLAAQCADQLAQKVSTINRRTLDPLAALSYFYYSRVYELLGKLKDIRSFLHARLRSSTLHHDDAGQATLLNLLLRNYIQYNLYDQAEKLVSKSSFPESASNNEWARFLYYLGLIKAIQLDYSEAHKHLLSAIRKAPQHTAVGFKQHVHRLAIVVQLLLGEIPDRKIFREAILKKTLVPYFQLTQAVRTGDLKLFNKVVEQYKEKFQAERTFTLIIRLHHNVIKTGIRTISLAYSRISLVDVANKLQLDSAEDSEFIVAKAIRDGVIEATIDHEHGYVQSKENIDVYSTTEPQNAFHQRISFSLDIYNQSVKAMRYPPKAYNKDLESLEEQREREKQDLEYAKEIAEDDDDFP